MNTKQLLCAISGLFSLIAVNALGQVAFAAQLTVTNPNSKVLWYKGFQYDITWIGSDVAQPVRLDLVQGSDVIKSITEMVPVVIGPGAVHGQHSWRIPSDLSDGQYQVRAQTTNKKVTGLSEPFEIKAPLVLGELPEMHDLKGRVQMVDFAQMLAEKECHTHANDSVQWQYVNKKLNCGLTGPKWHSDYQAHFDWCMDRIFSNRTEVETRYDKGLEGCQSLIAMNVKLTKLEIHDDCDNISEGDWYVSLGAWGSTTNSGKAFTIWPGTKEAQNVDTGDTHHPNLKNTLVVKGNDTLSVMVGAVDCDGAPGAWFWPLIGVPIITPATVFAPYEQNLSGVDCSGEEEIWEISGANDFLDYTILELPPSKWKIGGNFKIVAGIQAIQECGSNGPPYTAHISIQRVFSAP